MGLNQRVRCGWKPAQDPELQKPEFEDEEPELKPPPERPAPWAKTAPSWRAAPAPAAEPKRYIGTVRSFTLTYGFLWPDQGFKGIFFHCNEIRMEGWRSLKAGTRVEYSLGKNARGVCAVDVKPL